MEPTINGDLAFRYVDLAPIVLGLFCIAWAVWNALSSRICFC